jgi:hypothetical protein
VAKYQILSEGTVRRKTISKSDANSDHAQEDLLKDLFLEIILSFFD